MAKYLVIGTAGPGSSCRGFEKVVEASSEKLAREYVANLLGANAGIKRSAIKIKSVEKV